MVFLEAGKVFSQRFRVHSGWQFIKFGSITGVFLLKRLEAVLRGGQLGLFLLELPLSGSLEFLLFIALALLFLAFLDLLLGGGDLCIQFDHRLADGLVLGGLVIPGINEGLSVLDSEDDGHNHGDHGEN